MNWHNFFTYIKCCYTEYIILYYAEVSLTWSGSSIVLCRTRAERTLTTFWVSLREMAKTRRVLPRSRGNSGRRSSLESLLGHTSRKNTPILSTEMGMAILCQPATLTNSWWTTNERVSWIKRRKKLHYRWVIIGQTKKKNTSHHNTMLACTNL